jgi:hypothetical protein
MAKVRKGIGNSLKMITRIKDQKQKGIKNKKMYGKDKEMDGTKGPKDIKA